MRGLSGHGRPGYVCGSMSCGSATKMRLMGVCARFLEARVSISLNSLPSSKTSDSAYPSSPNLSHRQLSIAVIEDAPLAPIRGPHHQSTTSAFASVKSLLKLQSPLLSALYLLSANGRMRYVKRALTSRPACRRQASPVPSMRRRGRHTRRTWSSSVVKRKRSNAGAAFFEV